MRYTCVNAEIDEYVSRVMMTMGISPALNGFAYLKMAIEMYLFNDYNMNEICEGIACNISVSKKSVERDMRTALNASQEKELQDKINDFAGFEIVYSGEKLCVKEFIATVCELISFLYRTEIDKYMNSGREVGA